MKYKLTEGRSLEREFLMEEMSRYIKATPNEAIDAALEIYDAYLDMKAQYLALKAENLQLQERVRTPIETPPFFDR